MSIRLYFKWALDIKSQCPECNNILVGYTMVDWPNTSIHRGCSECGHVVKYYFWGSGNIIDNRPVLNEKKLKKVPRLRKFLYSMWKRQK